MLSAAAPFRREGHDHRVRDATLPAREDAHRPGGAARALLPQYVENPHRIDHHPHEQTAYFSIFFNIFDFSIFFNIFDFSIFLTKELRSKETPLVE
jgi:hypothetical protein